MDADPPPVPDRAGRLRLALVAVAIVLTLLGGALALRSGVRLYRHVSGPPPAARQADPAHIAGWMTVPYVARAYGVSGQELFAAIELSPDGNRNRSLNELADASGRDRDELVAVVRRVVHDARPPPRDAAGDGSSARAPPPPGTRP